MSLSEYWHVLAKRKWVVVFTALFFGLTTLGLTMMQTPVYQTSATVRIDQLKSVMNVISDLLRWSPGEIMSTEVETAQSRGVLEKTAEKLGMIKPGDSEDQRSAIITGLQASVKAERVENTNMIRINVTSSDPKQAARLANTIAEVYKDVSKANKSKDVVDAKQFVEKQLENAKERLRKSEEGLRDYKQVSGTLSVDSETQITLDRLNSLETELLQIRSEREKLNWQLTDLHNRIQKLDVNKEIGALASSPLVKSNEMLINLRQQIDTLLHDYTENNPEIRNLRVEERKASDSLRREVQKQLSQQVQSIMTQDAGYARRENDLSTLINHELSLIPGKDMDLSRLTREVSVNEELYTMLNREYKQAQIREMGMVSEVTAVSDASVPKNPIRPNKKLNIIIGFALGLILGFVMTALVESFDTSIGAVEDIERLLETPVLAAVPRFEHTHRKKQFPFFQKNKPPASVVLDHTKALPTVFNPSSAAAEAYRHLRTNMSFARLKESKKVYLVSSSGPQEGKSITTSNLAVVMAQSGQRTLLMCCNLRRPTIHKIFGITRQPGLTDVLIGSCAPEEAVHTFADIVLGDMDWEAALQLPGIDNLSILPSGTLPPNPTELLESQKLTDLINYFRHEYDVILIDAPPILPVTDSLLIGPKVDGVVLVYQLGRLPRRALIRTRNLMRSLNINVVGIVLNDVRPEFHGVTPIYISQEYMSATRRNLASAERDPGPMES
ncbi:MAG: polysaccharide biosynthesis tyrosine autokinase [bacterium]